jgi:hypothetical protein
MILAPVALFVYNRLEHTKKTIEALQKNELAINSDLVIFSDGFKNSPESKSSVLVVREYLKTISGFKSIKIIERLENLGLANSIINGVTEIVNQSGKIIVLEDDLITSPYFLRYMNEALDLYENQEEVISIHGYIYPVKHQLPETFFIKGADCWGWATWKRGWDLFEADGQKLLSELIAKKLTREFDLGGYPYTQMLRGQIKGFNNSWAVRWYASAFLKNKLTLYPGYSLVSNCGFDNSGTHTGRMTAFFTEIYNKPVIVAKISVIENSEVRLIVARFFKTLYLRLFIIFVRYKFYLKIFKRICLKALNR